LAVAGHPEWRDELVRIRGREELASRLLELLEPVFVTDTTERWVERFRAAAVPVAPVLGRAEHLADPRVRHNQIYVEHDHPDLGRVRAARYPVQMGRAPAPYPALEEHGAAIRAALAERPVPLTITPPASSSALMIANTSSAAKPVSR
jgi:crotonobetainyl-CoA:carnitine CoA-transferase CaiB-like acyl-CoA transferase